MSILVYDAIIVGGGPAGLSAALILGRCRRRVLLCDEGKPRNSRSAALHGFLTRDGFPPMELLRLGREEILRYDVDQREGRVTDVRRGDGHFEVYVEGGTPYKCRKLLITTGMVDVLPDIEGIEAMYGRSVHHCPYCDGWEVRDRPLAAYGGGTPGACLALSLRIWSRDVVLCLDGQEAPSAEEAERLRRNGVKTRPERMARLEGTDGQLEQIVFREGPPLDRRTLFFTSRQDQRCDLANRLGCEFNEKGTVVTDRFERTNVPGLFIAGDASEDVQFVVVAAAEGAKAAVAINTELHEEDMQRQAR